MNVINRLLGPALRDVIQCVCVCVYVCVCVMWLSLYNLNCRLHKILYRTCPSVFLLTYGKSENRIGHEGQSEGYMYIYLLSFTWEVDRVERSRPRTNRSTPKKGPWCPFTGITQKLESVRSVPLLCGFYPGIT
jgi:hypothetical protein